MKKGTHMTKETQDDNSNNENAAPYTKIQSHYDGMDEMTAYAVEKLMESVEPVDESEIIDDQKNISIDILYERLAGERPDLKILTPKKECLSVSQKIRVVCKKCGHPDEARADRFLTKTAQGWEDFKCKGCRKNEKKRTSHDWLWQKTQYYIGQRLGKIVTHAKPKDGEQYTSLDDKLKIECKHGHSWVTTHRQLHKGAWCPRCRVMPGENWKIAPFPNFRKDPEPDVKFAVLLSAAGKHCGMRLEFPISEGDNSKGKSKSKSKKETEYLGICLVCKQAVIVTESQVLRKKYLCINKCVPSSMPSLSTIFVRSGMGLGDIEQTRQHAAEIYAEAQSRLHKWKKGEADLP
jgi:hypothetical protein